MEEKIKILIVAGARPNFVKIAPLIEEIKKNSHQIEYILVHTGQHYDYAMSKKFFEDLELPKPDIYLKVGSGTHAEQTGKIIIEFEKVCIKEKPDLVIVVGDVNSTLACSIVSAKLCIPLAHVEAGLRSFDRTMPEEINRKVTDSLSDYLFITCKDAYRNLIREGIPKENIFFVGNIMIDTLIKYKEKAKKSKILSKLNLMVNKEIKPYVLLTLHRPSNVDNRDNFYNIINALLEISKYIPVIFPVHPRTKKQIEIFKFGNYFNFLKSKVYNLKSKINCINPVGYLDFLQLMSNAKFVLTDSGGIQEETTFLGIPCLTLRENTERPVTITEGTNELVGTDRNKIINAALNILKNGGKKGKIPELWDGKTAERIVKIIRVKAKKIGGKF